MNGKISFDFAQLWPHLHDLSVAALAAAVILLGAVLLMELRCVVRLRHIVDNQLGRVFEQLDLLRFETQQLLEGQQSGGSAQPALATVPAQVVPARAAASAAASKAAASPPLASAVPAAAAPPRPLTAGQLSLPSAAATVAAPAVPSLLPGAVYQNAAALAASGASSREIAERLGLASGEARLLSSIAQARARRPEAAGA